jgi:putative ABC transport system permease protein
MLRWSWRDLRRRWGLVLLTAVIIAIGTGTYAGLGGTTPWRLSSADASYERLRYHDLRIVLPQGTDVAQGRLRAATRAIPGADRVVGVTERLSVSIQVDASAAAGGAAVLVPGQLVGAPPDPAVDRLYVDRGRPATPGGDEVVLESKFVGLRHLPATGSITISGDQRLRYTGTGVTPEYFSVIGSGQGITGAYGFAVVYGALDDVQRLTGKAGRVTDAVVRLRPGTDADRIAAQLGRALADVGATIDTRADDVVRRSLYADARNDEKTWTALSLLILAGASFAAFNLVNRMVEAERHEIGVAMALGAPVRRLALRPLLVGAQIALAGVVLGVVVGLGAGALMRGLLTDLLPLPVWHTPFPVARYAQAAVAGIVLPMIATAIPVRRALRVEPVEALRNQVPGSGRRGAGLAPILRRFRLRGHVVALMPLRNVARAPRRTLLTALGIGAAITSLVAVLGILDSMSATFSRSDREVAGAAPDRLEVGLSSFRAADDPTVAAIADSPVVAEAEPGLRISGIMRHDGHEVETIIDLVDMAHAMWRPTAARGTLPVGRPGLVISEKAAADLGVGPGDRIVLHHPVRQGTSYRLVDTTVTVAAIHPNPLRFFTYVDTSQVGLFDLGGIVDVVLVRPAPGHDADDVKRALFAQPGVGSVQEVAVLGDLIRDRVKQFTGILRVLEGFALSLALLIALNSATLTMEERRREQATMFAFGLPVRVVLRTIVVETFLTAVVGTLLGIAGGIVAMHWLIHMFTTETFPELGMRIVLSPTSALTVLALGIGVSSLAPVLAVRRLLRTDIPSTLRVLE